MRHLKPRCTVRLYDPECYTLIIAAQPEAAWAYQLRGQIYRRLGNTKQADADAGCAAELLERNLPTGPDALKEVERAGSYYMRSNSWDMAVIFYSKAIEFKNAELWYYNERGFAYSVLEQYHEAVSDYTKVIALDPRRGNYYARRGYAYLRCGEQEKALADYAKVLELNPDYSNDGWSLHCARMLVAGLGGRAAALVEKLVRDFPDEPRYAEQLHNVHSELAANFIRARRFTDSEKSYSEAIKHKPDDAMLWLRRTEFYGLLGLWDLTAKDSAAAFKLQPPATPNLCLSHAVLSLYVGDPASYRQLCALIPKRFGPDTDYRGWDSELTRACTIGPAAEADVVAWAVQRAERGVKRDPSPWSYCALGRAYFRARKYEQAVVQLKRALEVNAILETHESVTIASRGCGA